MLWMVGVRTQRRYHVEAPEICPGRNPRKRSRAEVRAVIVVMKRGNAHGARDGREVERQGP